ncbi:MAG TPA: PilX N-terminal domain-containing pilus assembly protein [Candidatus Macondimonas sp.]|nr:PilX N-terminal domain-containing pilus assembly protein [Candidatus Macondimonas sp.]
MAASALPVPRRQRGMVLMVALVMLLVVTLLAVMTLGTATTEQRIAATAHFRNMGFQAGESAIEAAMTNVPHLSAALLSPTPVDLTVTLGSAPVTAVARTSYLGDASNITGYAIGSQSQFAAYHFMIAGTGTAGASGANLSAVTAQGIYRIAPAVAGNN